LEIGSDIEIGKPQFSKSLVSENFEHIPHPEKQYTFKFTKKKPVKPDDPPLYPPSKNIHTIAPCLL
jgi:hypothetical protein